MGEIMKKIFAFCNQKGGVGKTTSVINISTVLAKEGLKVLLIDMDAQANATSGVGEEKPSIEFTTYQLLVENDHPLKLIKQTAIKNLSLIPSNTDLSGAELDLISRPRREFVLKEKISLIANNYDYIFIDCPPSLGLTTINALSASDYIIIPMQCEYYALEGLSYLLGTFQLVQKNLNPSLEIGGVILTMADFRTNLTQQVIEEVRNFFKDKVFDTIIPRSVRLSEAPSFGKPAVIYDPLGKGSRCYQAIGRDFIKRFGPKPGLKEAEFSSIQKQEENGQKEEITI